MKKILVLIALFPIAAYSSHLEEDFFTINEHGTDALLHFSFEDEEDMDFFNSPKLSFLEMEESQEALLPWATEKFSQKGISVFSDDMESDFEEFEDEVFSYTKQGYEAKGNCLPTLEKVPEGRKHLFGRPKVVPSNRPKDEKVTPKKVKERLAQAGENN